MTTKRYFSILALVLAGLSACGEDPKPPVDAGRGAEVETEAGADGQAAPVAARPGTLFKADYRIIGTPVVGSPVAIDLEIDSSLGEATIEIGYQIPDPSALAMDEAQPRTLTRTPQAGEQRIRERVTVIPQIVLQCSGKPQQRERFSLDNDLDPAARRRRRNLPAGVDPTQSGKNFPNFFSKLDSRHSGTGPKSDRLKARLQDELADGTRIKGKNQGGN